MYFPTGDDEPAIPSSAKFTSLARAQLKAMGSPPPFALAYAMAEANAPMVVVYATAASRDADYNGRLASPGGIEWLGKLTRDSDGDWISSAIKKITATTVTTRQTDWTNQIPWVVAGGVVIAAAVYLTRTMKKRRGGARRGGTVRRLARARRSR